MGDVLSRIAACVACTCFFFLGTFKLLGVFQQCGYRAGRFVRWLRRRENLYYNRLALWSGLRSFRRRSFPCAFRSRGRKPPCSSRRCPFSFSAFFSASRNRKYALKVP